MISTSVKNSILNAMLGKTNSISIASECWLGLLTSAPASEAATEYAEVQSVTSGVDNGYARTQLGAANSQSSQKMTVNGGVATNQDAIFLCECLEHTGVADYPLNPWGTATHFGIFTAKTGGSLIAWGKILNAAKEEAPITAEAGQIPVIRKNQLEISITSED